MAFINIGNHDYVPVSKEENAIVEDYFLASKPAGVVNRIDDWFSIPLLGSRGVGKETLLNRVIPSIPLYASCRADSYKIVHGTSLLPEQPFDPTQIDRHRKQTTINTRPWIISWNSISTDSCTAGDPESELIRQNVRNSNACVLVYNMCSKPSFEALSTLYESIFIEITKTPYKWDLPCNKKPIIVVANKAELPSSLWAISRHEGERFAASIGGTFLETSAKEDVGVKEMTVAAIKGALIHYAKEGLEARLRTAAEQKPLQRPIKEGNFGKPRSTGEQIRWYGACIIAKLSKT